MSNFKITRPAIRTKVIPFKLCLYHSCLQKSQMGRETANHMTRIVTWTAQVAKRDIFSEHPQKDWICLSKNSSRGSYTLRHNFFA